MLLKQIAGAFAMFGLIALATPDAATAGEVIKTATFTGASKHVTVGTVEIVKDGDVTKIVFADDFSLDGAPDPKVAWGNDGYVRGSIFSKLKKLKGAQEYIVPAGTDVAQYNEVWIWCEKFDVPLGVAKLK